MPSSGRNHLRDDMLSFMQEVGLPADLSLALPIQVASVLAAKDARGPPQVHDVECPMAHGRQGRRQTVPAPLEPPRHPSPLFKVPSRASFETQVSEGTGAPRQARVTLVWRVK